mmetsp:Transcript_35181/g.113315  ORF Transcript_35181/g.113315 Transcript_35181/m.113315 type:complete len:272 (-) Transcript_35181:484-1299(-)
MAAIPVRTSPPGASMHGATWTGFSLMMATCRWRSDWQMLSMLEPKSRRIASKTGSVSASASADCPLQRMPINPRKPSWRSHMAACTPLNEPPPDATSVWSRSTMSAGASALPNTTSGNRRYADSEAIKTVASPASRCEKTSEKNLGCRPEPLVRPTHLGRRAPVPIARSETLVGSELASEVLMSPPKRGETFGSSGGEGSCTTATDETTRLDACGVGCCEELSRSVAGSHMWAMVEATLCSSLTVPAAARTAHETESRPSPSDMAEQVCDL